MNTGKLILGILAGAAVGAALGVLLAPEKGSVTRKQITSKGEDFWDSLKAKFDNFVSSASEEIENAKNEAEDLYAKGKEKVQETKNDLKTSIKLNS